MTAATVNSFSREFLSNGKTFPTVLQSAGFDCRRRPAGPRLRASLGPLLPLEETIDLTTAATLLVHD